MHILPVEESKKVLTFLEKEEDVLQNAYLNIAHASSKGVVKDSEFNQDQDSSTLVVNLNDELCVISRFKNKILLLFLLYLVKSFSLPKRVTSNHQSPQTLRSTKRMKDTQKLSRHLNQLLRNGS
jgi:hypothetical protein